MPIVLVHGNPETDAIWADLRQHLGREDVVAPSPPGFGAPAPPDFGATSDDYVAWLASGLERLDGPIDLVGHDWGGSSRRITSAGGRGWRGSSCWAEASSGSRWG